MGDHDVAVRRVHRDVHLAAQDQIGAVTPVAFAKEDGAGIER